MASWPFGVRASARPGLSTSGAHGSSEPSLPATAAYRCRVWPATAVTSPPKYTASAVGAMVRTVAVTDGRKAVLTWQLAMSIAARLLTPVPLTDPKKPPAYRVLPSGETASARTVASSEPTVKLSRQPAGWPVAASKAAKLATCVSSVPAAAPGGRIDEKVPPTKTRPSAWAIAQTTPLV